MAKYNSSARDTRKVIYDYNYVHTVTGNSDGSCNGNVDQCEMAILMAVAMEITTTIPVVKVMPMLMVMVMLMVMARTSDVGGNSDGNCGGGAVFK